MSDEEEDDKNGSKKKKDKKDESREDRKGEPREHYWEAPYLQGGRVFQSLVARDKSFEDLFKYIVGKKESNDRARSAFAILAGGPGTGKTRLLEDIAYLAMLAHTNEGELRALIKKAGIKDKVDEDYIVKTLKNCVPVPITFNSVMPLNKSAERDLELSMGLRLLTSYLFKKLPKFVIIRKPLYKKLMGKLTIDRAIKIIVGDIKKTWDVEKPTLLIEVDELVTAEEIKDVAIEKMIEKDKEVLERNSEETKKAIEEEVEKRVQEELAKKRTEEGPTKNPTEKGAEVAMPEQPQQATKSVPGPKSDPVEEVKDKSSDEKTKASKEAALVKYSLSKSHKIINDIIDGCESRAEFLLVVSSLNPLIAYGTSETASSKPIKWINMPMPTSEEIMRCMTEGVKTLNIYYENNPEEKEVDVKKKKACMNRFLKRNEVKWVVYDCGSHFRTAELLFKVLLKFPNANEPVISIRDNLFDEMNDYVKNYNDITLPMLKAIFMGGNVELTASVDPSNPKSWTWADLLTRGILQNSVYDSNSSSITPSVCMNLLMSWAKKTNNPDDTTLQNVASALRALYCCELGDSSNIGAFMEHYSVLWLYLKFYLTEGEGVAINKLFDTPRIKTLPNTNTMPSDFNPCISFIKWVQFGDVPLNLKSFPPTICDNKAKGNVLLSEIRDISYLHFGGNLPGFDLFFVVKIDDKLYPMFVEVKACWPDSKNSATFDKTDLEEKLKNLFETIKKGYNYPPPLPSPDATEMEEEEEEEEERNPEMEEVEEEEKEKNDKIPCPPDVRRWYDITHGNGVCWDTIYYVVLSSQSFTRNIIDYTSFYNRVAKDKITISNPDGTVETITPKLVLILAGGSLDSMQHIFGTTFGVRPTFMNKPPPSSTKSNKVNNNNNNDSNDNNNNDNNNKTNNNDDNDNMNEPPEKKVKVDATNNDNKRAGKTRLPPSPSTSRMITRSQTKAEEEKAKVGNNSNGSGSKSGSITQKGRARRSPSKTKTKTKTKITKK